MCSFSRFALKDAFPLKAIAGALAITGVQALGFVWVYARYGIMQHSW